MTTLAPTSTGLQTTAGLPPINTNPTHAHTEMKGGQAVFENDNYRITAGDNNNVNIFNKKTGETYNIWGDPHVQIDGQQAFDFWGTTTFKLEDGTKVTIDTTPWGNSGMTLASKVTITSGDYGVQISGVDTNKVGDLKIDEAKGWGETLDWVRADGNVLQENPAGKGFLAVDTNGNIQKVDQAYINKTDLVKNPGLDPANSKPWQPQAQPQVDQLAQQFSHLFSAFTSILSIAFSGAMLGALQGQGGDDGRRYIEPVARDLNRFALTLLRA